MVLTLNLFALCLSLLISASIFIFNYKNQSRLFYIRIAIILIPAFAEMRQILLLTDTLTHFPFYLFVVYFMLRLIGPLINWHTHIQFGKKINFLSIIHLITYLVWLYTFYLIAEFYLLTPNRNPQELIQQFIEPSLYSFSYPLIMLMHVGQAGFIIYKERKKNYPLASFMKFAVSSVLISLVILQTSYFIFSRETVELIVAPLIFIGVYFSLIVLNVHYANIFAEKPSEKEAQKQSVSMKALTERENEVLERIAIGYTDKQIADELFLSVHTVATYCRRVYTKLEVRNRTEAANLYNRQLKS